MLVGYARVSTADQSLHLQRDALKKAGCKRIFTDVASGANAERPGLAKAIEFVRRGDTIDGGHDDGEHACRWEDMGGRF